MFQHVMRRARRTSAAWLLGWALAILPPASPAHAQPSDHAVRCRRIRALAESQSALLLFPSVWVEGLHVPQFGVSGGATSGDGIVGGPPWQLRTALSYSPLDTARGAVLLAAAESRCRQAEALTRARQALELGKDLGRLPAAEAEVRALVHARSRVAAWTARMDERVEAGLATEHDRQRVRREVARIEQRVDQLHSEIKQLRAAGHDDIDATSLRDDLDAYERATMTLERQRSDIRRMMPFTVNVRAGVVPIDNVDWFGQVTLGINLGALMLNGAEDAYLDARAEELTQHVGELRSRVDRLTESLKGALSGVEAEADRVQTQAETLAQQCALFERVETVEVDTLRVMTQLSLVFVSAQRARLRALTTYLSRLVEGVSQPSSSAHPETRNASPSRKRAEGKH